MGEDPGSLRQAQDRQGRDGNIFEVMFLRFATHLAIPWFDQPPCHPGLDPGSRMFP